MDRIIPVIAIGVVVILVAGLLVMGIYNGEVSRDQGVQSQWSNVETEYQKRFDLVPQLVSVVKGAASFEQETLNQLTALRSQWQTQTSVSDRMDTANQFESTLSKLLLITENYPELKSNEQFQTLQIQLEGIENRVSVERKKYNDSAREYNTYIRVFPNTFFLGGKELKIFFESTAGSEVAPIVPDDFTNN
ncbi:MAG: LemA family protein [Candidatus Diapherotrites archaeon]